jgi:hypothetical protein
MKKLNFGTLGLVAILAGFAVPAGATTISNNTSVAAATFTTSGIGNDVGAINSALSGFFSFSPFMPPIAVKDVNFEYAGGTSTTVTIVETAAAGVSGYAGIAASTVLFTFNLSAPLTLQSVGSNAALFIPTITSVTGNGQFLTDMGISSTFANGLEFGSLFVQGSDTSNVFTPNSFGFAVSTPEPVSCVLFGSGVLVVGLMRRKKLFGPRS